MSTEAELRRRIVEGDFVGESKVKPQDSSKQAPQESTTAESSDHVSSIDINLINCNLSIIVQKLQHCLSPKWDKFIDFSTVHLPSLSHYSVIAIDSFPWNVFPCKADAPVRFNLCSSSVFIYVMR